MYNAHIIIYVNNEHNSNQMCSTLTTLMPKNIQSVNAKNLIFDNNEKIPNGDTESIKFILYR